MTNTGKCCIVLVSSHHNTAISCFLSDFTHWAWFFVALLVQFRLQIEYTIGNRKYQVKFLIFDNFVEMHKIRGQYMDVMLERIRTLIGNRHGAKKELAQSLQINQNIITSQQGVGQE